MVADAPEFTPVAFLLESAPRMCMDGVSVSVCANDDLCSNEHEDVSIVSAGAAALRTSGLYSSRGRGKGERERTRERERESDSFEMLQKLILFHTRLS